MNTSTGEKIRYYRNQFGITQKELGEMTGMSGDLIRKYEANIRKPKLEKLKKISDALGVDFKVFLSAELKDFFANSFIEEQNSNHERIQLLHELRMLRKENKILKERLEKIKTLALL